MKKKLLILLFLLPALILSCKENIIFPWGLLGVRIALRNESITVIEILEKGAANDAGIEPGDIINSVNGISFNNTSSFIDYIRRTPPDTILNLKIQRFYDEISINVKMAEFNRKEQLLLTAEESIRNKDPKRALDLLNTLLDEFPDSKEARSIEEMKHDLEKKYYSYIKSKKKNK